PGDHGHRVGGKFHIVGQVELVDGLQKADTSDLEQILHLRSPSTETLYNAPYKSCVFLHNLCLRLFIPFVRLLYQSDCVVHSSLPLPISFLIFTVVPLPGSDSTSSS